MSSNKTVTANAGAERKSSSTKGRMNVRYMTVTAMMSALSFLLMFVEFSIPIMPSFIRLDISELPALVGSFAMGPVYGVAICLIKNLLHLTITSTGGVGELSNFILGASFVFTAGLVYARKKTRKRAVLGAALGAVIMALISIASNYFVVYPFYTAFMPMDTIIAMYQEIVQKIFSLDVEMNLLQCLVFFNAPFTFVKGMLNVLITLLIYKHISPIIKGTSR